jgi:hypothetical protein
MRSKLLFSAVVLLFCAGICQATVSECDTFEYDGDQIQECLVIDEFAYATGYDEMTLQFTITNLMPDSIFIVYLYQGIRAVFEVRDSLNQLVWEYPEWLQFMPWWEQLAPGETVFDEVTWDLKNGSGEYVTPGIYTARGGAGTQDFPYAWIEVEFEVINGDPLGIDDFPESTLWSEVKSLFR